VAGGHGTWNLGTSEPRNLVWTSNFSKRASGALLKFSFTTSIWSQDPRTWNLEPPLRPPLAPPTAEPGTWNLDPGTWNLEPSAKISKIAPAARAEPGTSEPGTSYLLTRDPRNRNLGTLSRVDYGSCLRGSEPTAARLHRAWLRWMLRPRCLDARTARGCVRWRQQPVPAGLEASSICRERTRRRLGKSTPILGFARFSISRRAALGPATSGLIACH